MGTRPVKAVFGLSIQPRWRKCRRSCTSGVARTLSLFAGAWRGQVGPLNVSRDASYVENNVFQKIDYTMNSLRYSFFADLTCTSYLIQTLFNAHFFLQKTLIVSWERDQTSSGLCHLTPAQPCYPEWPLSTAAPRHLAPRPSFDQPAHPFGVRSIPMSSLSSPATLLLTPATPLPCTHPAVSSLQLVSHQPLGACTPPWLVRCHLFTVSTAPGPCRTCCWRGTPVMTSTRSTPV